MTSDPVLVSFERPAPLAWLRFEPAREPGPVELRCRLWPDGDDRLLATLHPHANRVDWQGS